MARKKESASAKRRKGYPLRDHADVLREEAREEAHRNEERHRAGREAGPEDLTPAELEDEGRGPAA